jgi:hypothetical protein
MEGHGHWTFEGAVLSPWTLQDEMSGPKAMARGNIAARVHTGCVDV